jgi:hypothetical protein
MPQTSAGCCFGAVPHHRAHARIRRGIQALESLGAHDRFGDPALVRGVAKRLPTARSASLPLRAADRTTLTSPPKRTRELDAPEDERSCRPCSRPVSCQRRPAAHHKSDGAAGAHGRQIIQERTEHLERAVGRPGEAATSAARPGPYRAGALRISECSYTACPPRRNLLLVIFVSLVDVLPVELREKPLDCRGCEPS